MASSNVSDKVWKELLYLYDGRCLNCGSEDDLSPAHYIAQSLGGEDTLDNLMLLCFECHRRQHDGRLLVVKIGDSFYFRPRSRRT